MLVAMTYPVSSADTEAIWSERVREWRAGGLSATAFCKGKGFAASTLRYWASRLATTAPPQLVRLVPKPSPPAPLVVEVGHARIAVSSGFDPALLAAVVGALGGSR